MKSICKPVVAGSFYSSNPDILKKEIQGYIDNITDSMPDNLVDILGVISPHAGYIYSGQCAAYSYKALKSKDFNTAVIIAPSHQSGDFYYSVGDYDSCETPLGEVEVDRDLVKKMLSDSKFVFYHYAHSREHSLEVQLPFLQIINPQAKILPILIGYQYDQSSLYLSQKLAELFKDKMDKTVFIISSDLSHYHSHTQAEQMDKRLAEAIEKLEIETVDQLVKERKSEACGFGGILTIMNLTKLLNYTKVKTLKYMHSGTTSGDYNHVVGYLSTLFYK
ncbi:MAG: AmmeMemoRadiSam system protein B [Candidatus Cloacimonetes bacterium]|nr:AmmeMemoRadiSam system protein B [Candidatus Cloacimonadota bacterium]